MSDRITPFDDAIHNVAGIVFLVGAERLGDKAGNVAGCGVTCGLIYVEYVQV